MKDWVVVYTTEHAWQAELIEGVLRDQGIDCVILNKQDSLYLFGHIELYVKADDVIAAKKTLESTTE